MNEAERLVATGVDADAAPADRDALADAAARQPEVKAVLEQHVVMERLLHGVHRPGDDFVDRAMQQVRAARPLPGIKRRLFILVLLLLITAGLALSWFISTEERLVLGFEELPEPWELRIGALRTGLTEDGVQVVETMPAALARRGPTPDWRTMYVLDPLATWSWQADTHISIMYRCGPAVTNLTLQVELTNKGRWIADLPLSADWRTHTVRLSDFRALKAGQPAPGGQVHALAVYGDFAGDGAGAFIRQIQFVRP